MVIALMMGEAAFSGRSAMLSWPVYLNIAMRVLVVIGLARIVFGWAPDVGPSQEDRIPPVFD